MLPGASPPPIREYLRAATPQPPGPPVNTPAARPWRWIPTLYFGQGIP